MIASVHLADVGVRSALSMTRKAPRPGSIPGLRNANVGLAAPLGGSVVPSVQFGRAGLFAFWDDDAALDGFLAEHPLAPRFAGGWSIRLEPLRAYGTWPGFPRADVTDARNVEHEGPVAALTMGRPRASQLLRFVRTSAKAEASAVAAPGLIWTTGLAKPVSFVATCSLWESTRALSTYAYGSKDPGHPDAITSGNEKPFHHEQIFIRFRPYDARGELEGKNPLIAREGTRDGT
jgi:hypothetical protein